MDNEMGNQNSNGLQVSEQESEGITKVVNPSPNASFMMNDLDGLQGLASSNSSRKEESTNKLVIDEPLKSSIVPNDVLDHSQAIPSTEYDVSEQESKGLSKVINQFSNASFMMNDLDGLMSSMSSSNNSQNEESTNKFVTDEPLKPSIVPNDALDQSQVIPLTEYDVFERHEAENLATDESLDSLIITNEEHAKFAPNECSETDVSAILRQLSERRVAEEDIDVAGKTISEHSEDVDLTRINGLKYLPHYLAYDHQNEHDADKSDDDENLEHLDVSKYTEERSQLSLTREYEAMHDEHTHSTHNESSERADSLTQKQTPEERCQKFATKF